MLAPASLVKVIAERGPWIHVSTHDGEQGWVEVEKIGRVIAEEWK